MLHMIGYQIDIFVFYQIGVHDSGRVLQWILCQQLRRLLRV